ncbi:histidine phosphatase family protein [Bacillus sp. EB600]|uniref:histidine phosphatase family protein n=1 Tax=Bacillus sp. EB600 TaxID=2806345 RepID=UPI00210A95D1|nr:histidine phosphatase family protein [Bacillus sp. EB600]MCQ6279127.1 phosphoglycerate mutase family protein [Bacillus sp. EB600]
MQITLIRHLPTEWNKKTWLQGKRDIGISSPTEELKEMIEANQRDLEKLSPFDLVLASTLKRTHQTAKLYGYEAETDALLDELDFGQFEGIPKEILMDKFGDKWLKNPKALVLGESIQHLEERISTFLGKYRGYQNLLVFGHGSWIRALLSYQKYGDINAMNKIIVLNNERITISINPTSPWNGNGDGGL